MIAAVKRQFTEKGNTKYLLLAGVAIGLVCVAMMFMPKKDGMSNGSGSGRGAANAPHAAVQNVPQPMQDGAGEQYASVTGGAASAASQAPAACNGQAQSPSELLPTDTNNDWAQMNPVGHGDLANVNLLKTGHHIGINTVGTSLRNPNLQVRSEPANPQMNTGPWNKSTIDPDVSRPSFEIGQGSM